LLVFAFSISSPSRFLHLPASSSNTFAAPTNYCKCPCTGKAHSRLRERASVLLPAHGGISTRMRAACIVCARRSRTQSTLTRTCMRQHCKRLLIRLPFKTRTSSRAVVHFSSHGAFSLRPVNAKLNIHCYTHLDYTNLLIINLSTNVEADLHAASAGAHIHCSLYGETGLFQHIQTQLTYIYICSTLTWQYVCQIGHSLSLFHDSLLLARLLRTPPECSSEHHG
jgi:hypothetical protein